MRKFFSVLFIALLCLFPFTKTLVKAEETEEIIEEIEETHEEVIVDENNELTEEKDFDQFKEQIEEYLAVYLEQSMVAKIITWAIDAGVLTALFFVYRKYSKYKHTTLEDLMKMFKEKMEKWLKEKSDELSKEQIAKIVESIEKLEESNETIMKVLVLAQDNTAKGKAALIEYLGKKTESQEVKNAVVEVNEKLAEKEKQDEIIKDAVKDDYVKIY